MASLPKADEYLVEVFEFLGLCSSNGMGQVPFSWCEIDAFKRNSSYHLTEWDCEQIVIMSKLYCSWVNKGKDPKVFSPWDDVEAYNNAKSP